MRSLSLPKYTSHLHRCRYMQVGCDQVGDYGIHSGPRQLPHHRCAHLIPDRHRVHRFGVVAVVLGAGVKQHLPRGHHR